jgi:hypothetical protein
MRALQAISPDDLDILLTWFAVLRVCAAVLAVEAIVLGLLSFVRPPKGVLRVGALVSLAIVSLAAAIGAGVLARNDFATYQELLPANYLPRSFTPAYYDRYLQKIAQAVAFYEAVGWRAVAVTAVLLIAGLILAVIAIRSRTAPLQRTARPSPGDKLPSAHPA